MMNIIIATDINGGIGYKNKLPWYIPEEFKIFREKTIGHIIIIGKRTYDSIPILKYRDVFIVSRNNPLDKCIDEALLLSKNSGKKIWICGGKYIYETFIRDYSYLLDEIHMSIISSPNLVSDTFIDLNLLKGYQFDKELIFPQFNHYVLKYNVQHCDNQYINLLKDVYMNGNYRNTRNAPVKSLFCKHLSFDMNMGFPLLTTKKMFWKGIVEEFIFFVKGDTDTKILETKGINIWKGNTCRSFLDSKGFHERPEGIMGPMYGYQWRFYGAEYDEQMGKPKSDGIDQLRNIIEELKTSPTSRRLLISDYNPSQVNEGVLPPCHSIIIQFYVNNSKLDMFCYNRSSDLFLGLPFNIASSSLLLHLVAKLTNLQPNILHLSLGDCHIYRDHFSAVSEQIKRIPWKLSNLKVNVEDLSTITSDDFILENYISHKSLKANMIA